MKRHDSVGPRGGRVQVRGTDDADLVAEVHQAHDVLRFRGHVVGQALHEDADVRMLPDLQGRRRGARGAAWREEVAHLLIVDLQIRDLHEMVDGAQAELHEKPLRQARQQASCLARAAEDGVALAAGRLPIGECASVEALCDTLDHCVPDILVHTILTIFASEYPIIWDRGRPSGILLQHKRVRRRSPVHTNRVAVRDLFRRWRPYPHTDLDVVRERLVVSTNPGGGCNLHRSPRPHGRGTTCERRRRRGARPSRATAAMAGRV
mmetsp:Transcript_5159/g.15244  ORF Transcript_5159/g.15244 Transcript_5159/m.15244 type:complete len:264 (+) Transcript_5159:1710-2501(+)